MLFLLFVGIVSIFSLAASRTCGRDAVPIAKSAATTTYRDIVVGPSSYSDKLKAVQVSDYASAFSNQLPQFAHLGQPTVDDQRSVNATSGPAAEWQDAPIVEAKSPVGRNLAVGWPVHREDGSYAGWIGPSGAQAPVSSSAGTSMFAAFDLAEEETASYPRYDVFDRLSQDEIADSGSRVAENDSYYGEISERTGRPKTVYVHGYTRRDGTPVQSHWRSSPRSSDTGTNSYKPRVATNGSYYGEISDTTGRPKTQYVSGYVRRDGSYVSGHYRSRR